MKIAVVVLVTVVLVAVGTYFGVRAYDGQLNAGPAPIEVRTERVSRGDLVELVSAPGQVEPLTKVSISSKIAARIIELPFKEGERITKGRPASSADPAGPAAGAAASSAGAAVPPSVLVRLDAADLAADLKASEARYAAARSQLEVTERSIRSAESELDGLRIRLADAERTLGRQRSLLSTGDVALTELEKAQLDLDQATNAVEAKSRMILSSRSSLEVQRHTLEANEADIAKQREALSYAIIESPIDGTVTRVNAKVGELVVTGTMNNAGTVIMEVADLSRMLVVARVDESAIAGVRVGQRATCRSTAYPGKTFGGRVTTVALTKTTAGQAGATGGGGDGSPYFKTEILLDEGITGEAGGTGRSVLSGVTMDVEIETERHLNVLRVPSQCVLGRPVDSLPADVAGDATVDRTRTIATVVYLMKPAAGGGARGDAYRSVVRPVRVGPSDVTHTRIDAGLEEGDVIILGPYKVLATIQHDTPVKLAPTTQPATPAATQPTSRPATEPAAAVPGTPTPPTPSTPPTP